MLLAAEEETNRIAKWEKTNQYISDIMYIVI